MILPFSTQMNGKPTYFVEKIHSGLSQNELIKKITSEFMSYGWDTDVYSECKPKLHTIREDKNDRWKPGTKIDFFINCRQKDMFRFAPVLPVVSVQRVFMTYAWADIIEISINGKQLHITSEILEFVRNDGFDNWEDFFNYFYPKIMSAENEEYYGKIIHWTDLRY